MRIQHNIMAMNAYRNYNNNTSALSKNLEKLSSGYKINRAGDDAAGLAISEKMRAQITGLNAAQKNVKDGISLVKTAEGAMQEIQDMLNRMDYLATQSANGTYQDEVDRENLNKEVNALKTEINRIADSANFNGIKLLDGSLAAGGTISGSTGSGEMVATVESKLASGDAVSLKTSQTGDAAVKGKYQVTIAGVADGTTGAAPAATDAMKFEITYRDADGNTQTKTIYTEADVSAGDSDTFADAIKTAVDADADLSKLFDVTVTDNKVSFEAKKAGTNGAQIIGLDLKGFVDNAASKVAGYDVAGTGVFGTGAGAQKVITEVTAADETTVDVIDFSGVTVAAGDTVTIGDKTYEFVAANGDNFSVAKGNIAVVIGATDAGTVNNLTEALKANGVTSAVADTATTGSERIRIGDLNQIKAANNNVKITTNNEDGIIIAQNTADKAVSEISVGAGSGEKASVEITYIDENGETQRASLGYTSTTAVGTNADAIIAAFEKNSNLSNLFTVTKDTTTGKEKLIITAKNAGANGGSIVSMSTTDTTVPDSLRGLRQVTAGRDAGQSVALDVDQMSEGDTLTIDGKTFQFVKKDNLDSVKDGNIAVILDKTSQTVTAANLNLAMKQNGMNVEFNASTNSFFIKNGESAGGKTNGLTLQIGDTADKFNQMTVSIGDMHVSAMGTGKTTLDGKTVNVTKTIADIDIGSLEGAQEAIAVVKNAINYVSGIRGDLGAVQNRLEHTQNNLSVMAENIQDAESTIRDTDVAEEMMSYVKNNILVQSAQAMLAQANQVPQGVLQLLG